MVKALWVVPSPPQIGMGTGFQTLGEGGEGISEFLSMKLLIKGLANPFVMLRA